MKMRHFWPVLAHRPWFVLRHGLAMIAHTFRGSTWRSWVGLEDERTVFARYKAIRRGERDYFRKAPLSAFRSPLSAQPLVASGSRLARD